MRSFPHRRLIGLSGLYIPNTGFRVVGAGVSTCAPVIIE